MRKRQRPDTADKEETDPPRAKRARVESPSTPGSAAIDEPTPASQSFVSDSDGSSVTEEVETAAWFGDGEAVGDTLDEALVCEGSDDTGTPGGAIDDLAGEESDCSQTIDTGTPGKTTSHPVEDGTAGDEPGSLKSISLKRKPPDAARLYSAL